VSHAQEAHRAELDAWRASLPLDEFARLNVDDGPLAHVLARLGSLVQERESARQTELRAKRIP
jgi:hypothetical protein